MAPRTKATNTPVEPAPTPRPRRDVDEAAVVGLTGSSCLRHSADGRAALRCVHLSLPVLLVAVAGLGATHSPLAEHLRATLPRLGHVVPHWSTVVGGGDGGGGVWKPLTPAQAWALGVVEATPHAACACGDRNDTAIRRAWDLLLTATTTTTTAGDAGAAETALTSSRHEEALSNAQRAFAKQEHLSKWSWLARCFSLINVFIAVGIVGTLATCLPAISVVVAGFGHALQWLWRTLGAHLARPVLYATCALVLLRAGDTAESVDVRLYTSLLAGGLAALGVGTTLVQLETVGALEEHHCDWSVTWFCVALLVPLTCATQSYLAGTLAVAGVFYAGGFVFDKSPTDMHAESTNQCEQTSWIFVAMVLLARTCFSRDAQAVLLPFEVGLQVFGVGVALLVRFIRATDNLWCWRPFTGSRPQAEFWLHSLSFVCVGLLLPLHGMAYVASVFAYLHVLQWLCWMTHECTRDETVALFVTFVVLTATSCGVLYTFPTAFASLNGLLVVGLAT